LQRSGRCNGGTGDTDAGRTGDPGIGELQLLLSRADRLDYCPTCLADWRRDFNDTGNPGAVIR